MKRQIVILANSIRESERCIAGIDIQTGEWIRPVSKHGAVPRAVRTVRGKEPELLDVLEIPLEDHGPDEGCQPENRLIKPGTWRKVGQLEPKDLLEYCEDDSVILHNHNKDRVLPQLLKRLPRNKWRSLQLVHSASVFFHLDYWGKRRAYFRDGKGYVLELAVKDPVFHNKLVRNQKVSSNCILTISLTTPWSRDETMSERCYKLVAGVVELPGM